MNEDLTYKYEDITPRNVQYYVRLATGKYLDKLATLYGLTTKEYSYNLR